MYTQDEAEQLDRENQSLKDFLDKYGLMENWKRHNEFCNQDKNQTELSLSDKYDEVGI